VNQDLAGNTSQAAALFNNIGSKSKIALIGNIPER